MELVIGSGEYMFHYGRILLESLESGYLFELLWAGIFFQTLQLQ